MDNIIYSNVLASSISVLLLMGGFLILGRVPHSQRGTNYYKSRIVLGVTYVILALQIAAFLILNLRLRDSAYATALSLTTYLLLSALFSYSFITLLGHSGDRLTKHLLTIHGFSLLLFTILIFSSISIFTGVIEKIVLFISSLIYLCAVILQTWFFIRCYKEALHRAENYYSESINNLIKWMPKSTYHIVTLGFLGVLLTLSPPYVIVIYTIYGIGVLIYTFTNMIYLSADIYHIGVMTAHTIKHEELIPNDVVIEGIEAGKESLSHDIIELIDTNIATWISSRGFIKHGVTIQSVARDIYTNRTYLSLYIKAKYGCSFRNWILALRIKEAKEVMKSNHSVSISVVAAEVGFSSPSSFSRAFTRSEGISPSRWRERCNL
ncbi:MAG: helix-turn-helix domain-containing protein [Rikenellaceae bacterium]